MPPHKSSEATIREQAYYYWEQDGRPFGRDNEYWQRAVIALTAESDAGALTRPAPKRAEVKKPKTAAPKAAASRSKEAPTKSDKGAAVKKPKKK